jgi:hypothetical protein
LVKRWPSPAGAPSGNVTSFLPMSEVCSEMSGALGGTSTAAGLPGDVGRSPLSLRGKNSTPSPTRATTTRAIAAASAMRRSFPRRRDG